MSYARKHTSGPWVAGHLGSDGECQCTSVLADGYLGSICQVSVNNGRAVGDGGNDAPPRDEAIANMHLIAAAPDLLDALKDALRSCRKDFPAGNDGDLLFRESYAEQLAAIAKAEGQS